MTSQGRMRLLALMVAAALGFALWSAQASHAVACSTTWNGATADWSTAADWDNGLPDANSIVCISSGHPTVTTDAVVAELRLSGSATLTVDDSHVYTDDPSTGDFPDGPMTVASGATLQETGAASELQGGSIDNNGGTVQMATGGSRIFRFTSYTNSGTLNVDTDVDIDTPGTPTLTNTGTIDIAAGKNFTATNTTLNQNGGQITGGAGSTLKLTGGAINHSGGNVDSNVTAGIVGGSIDPSGTGTAAYSVVGSAGTTLSGNVASGMTLRVRGGEFGSNSAKLVLAADRNNNGAILLDSLGNPADATLDVGAHTLTNNGTLHVLLSDFGDRIINGSTGTLANASTGSLILDQDTSIDPTVTNAGAVSIASDQTATLTTHGYTQTAGSTSGLGSIGLPNAANVAIQGGVLSLGGTGSTIDGNLSNTGGDVSPCGLGTACTLTVTGNYTQGSLGTLTADVVGSSPDPNHPNDLINLTNGASNNASVDGTLKIASTGFTPASGDIFNVVEADGNVTGTFATSNQVGGGGRTYAVNYLRSLNSPPVDRVRLTVVPQFLLTVGKAGAGSGVVSSSPGGIGCGSSCTQPYDTGTPVTLSASADPGSTFTGWSGEGCSGTGTCTVTMSQARSVTATFTQTDADGDGVPQLQDCNDHNAAIRPGATDIPDNGVDEDCSGADAHDRTAPVTSGLAASPSTFRAASRGGSIAAARRPIGTTVRYRLSEPARVRLTVERETVGRKVGKHCGAPTRSNRAKRRCTRYVAVRGSFTQTGRQGTNSFKFTGRLSGRKLAPGVYRLTGVPTDAAGNRGLAQFVRFTIVP